MASSAKTYTAHCQPDGQMQTASSWSITQLLLHCHCNIYKVHKHYVSELQLPATFSQIARLLEEWVFDFQAALHSGRAACCGFMGISWVFNEAHTVTNPNNSWSWNPEAHSVKLMEPETPREKYWMNQNNQLAMSLCSNFAGEYQTHICTE